VMIMKMRKKVSKSQMKTNLQPARKKMINQYFFPFFVILRFFNNLFVQEINC
jgi:hypothetical protein